MSSRIKVVLAGGVAVLLVLGWFFIYFGPAGDDLSEVEDEIDEARAEEAALEETLSQLQQLDEEAPAQEASLRELNAAVPDEAELDTFILEANQIAVESGIDWLAISPSPPAVGAVGAASVIAMTIEIEGGFFQALDYLNRLEDLERVVVVDGLTISAGAETGDGTGDAEGISGTGAPRLSMNLTARMFTRSDAAFGGVDGGATPETGDTGTETTTPGTAPPSTDSGDAPT